MKHASKEKKSNNPYEIPGGKFECKSVSLIAKSIPLLEKT